MRFYSFTNMYTIGIHAGIQTAHAVHEMGRKYSKHFAGLEKLNVYNEWADNHKTIIVLRAGDHSDLNALYERIKLAAAAELLPIIKQCENERSLNGATTAIGLIVPEHIYVYSDSPKKTPHAELLAKTITSYSLAT